MIFKLYLKGKEKHEEQLHLHLHTYELKRSKICREILDNPLCDDESNETKQKIFENDTSLLGSSTFKILLENMCTQLKYLIVPISISHVQCVVGWSQFFFFFLNFLVQAEQNQFEFFGHSLNFFNIFYLVQAHFELSYSGVKVFLPAHLKLTLYLLFLLIFSKPLN